MSLVLAVCRACVPHTYSLPHCRDEAHLYSITVLCWAAIGVHSGTNGESGFGVPQACKASCCQQRVWVWYVCACGNVAAEASVQVLGFCLG